MVCATGEKDTLVSALFAASFVVSDAAFRLPLAGMSSWCVVVVFGFTYGPVNPLFLLAGHGIIVSSKRGVGCGSSSSDPLFLFRLRSLVVAWKKSLEVDYWVLCYSLGSSGFTTPHLSIQSGSGGCVSLFQLP